MPDVPDVYTDQFSISQNPYGIALTFALSSPQATSIASRDTMPLPQVVARMSWEHAKIMAMVLTRLVRQYELEHLGDTIKVPQALTNQLALPPNGEWP